MQPRRMSESGIMVQPDFRAISYEELCDTNPSKPTRARGAIAGTIGDGGLCSSSVMPSVASALFRFSEELGMAKNVLSRAQEVGCVGILEQVPASDAVLPGVCPNPKRPRVVPVIVACVVGRKLSLLPREKTSSGSGQTHRKAFRVQVHNAKGKSLRRTIWNCYCQKLNARLRRHERRLHVSHGLFAIVLPASDLR